MHHIDFSVTAQVEELPSSRDRIRTWLIDAGEPVDEWPLVLSELLANAVAATTEPIVIRMEISTHDVMLQVTDQGPGFELAIRSPDVAGRRGRGLWIVNTLTDSLVVEQTAAGNTVRCRRSRVDLAPEPAHDGHSADGVVFGDEARWSRLEPFGHPNGRPDLDGRRRTDGHGPD